MGLANLVLKLECIRGRFPFSINELRMALLLRDLCKMILTHKLQHTRTILRLIRNLESKVITEERFSSHEEAQLHLPQMARRVTAKRMSLTWCKKKWRRGTKAQEAEDRLLDPSALEDNRSKLDWPQLVLEIRNSTRLLPIRQAMTLWTLQEFLFYHTEALEGLGCLIPSTISINTISRTKNRAQARLRLEIISTELNNRTRLNIAECLNQLIHKAQAILMEERLSKLVDHRELQATKEGMHLPLQIKFS